MVCLFNECVSCDSLIDDIVKGKSLDYLFNKYKFFAKAHPRHFLHLYDSIKNQMKRIKYAR